MPALALPDPAGPDAEARLLAPWRAAYARRFGRAPELARDEHGLVLRFPAHAGPTDALGRVDVFGGHPAVRAWLHRLGFAWDDRGLLAATPSPASFRARLGRDAGPRPRYYQCDSSAMPLRTWLEGNLRGELPLQLGGPRWYAALAVHARLRLPEPARIRAARDYHFLGVQHDLTKHLALTHLVPRRLLDELARALAGGLRPWHRGPLSPAPLLRFYENDLLAYCQQIWRDLPDPAQFAAVCEHPPNLAQLWRAVDTRLAETAAGPRRWHSVDTCPTFTIAHAVATASSAP